MLPMSPDIGQTTLYGPGARKYFERQRAGDAPASRFALAYGAMTIGRQPGSEILLHDPMFSHVHAVIETTPAGVTPG